MKNLGEFQVIADSEMIAEYTDRTFAFIAEAFASVEYPLRAMNPTVASTANMAITIMSSAKVNADHFLLRISRIATSTLRETESESFLSSDIRPHITVKNTSVIIILPLKKGKAQSKFAYQEKSPAPFGNGGFFGRPIIRLLLLQRLLPSSLPEPSSSGLPRLRQLRWKLLLRGP